MGGRLAGLGLALTADSSHHISNCVSLLLRIALYDRAATAASTELRGVDAASACAIQLVDTLVGVYAAWRWDVADAALRRIAPLLLFATRELPMLAESYAGVAKAFDLNIPCECSGQAEGACGAVLTAVHEEAALSADQLLASLGPLGGGHPSVGTCTGDWLETDLSWLDSGLLFGALGSTVTDGGAPL